MSTQKDTYKDKKSKWKEREMGALWKKQGNSQTYLSGTLEIPTDGFGGKEKVNVVIYSNKYKEEGTQQPDFRVYRSEEMKKDKEAVSETSSKATSEQSDDDNEILD